MRPSKTGMEKEENIHNLTDGGYWDKQIRTLQNDKLPANKKQITLQTRHKNHYSQLEIIMKNQAKSSLIKLQIVNNFPVFSQKN